MEQVKEIALLLRASISDLERLSLSLAEDTGFASESATSRSHLSRLKLWSGCLGAHRSTGNRSLSYRLRDASSIRRTVLFLLENLERYIKEARTIAQQASVEQVDEGDSGNSTDEELAEYFCSKDGDESPNKADLKRILLQIEEVLDCLMRLAITIRNPAPYDQFRSRVGAVSLPYQWDIEHVQHKFPNTNPIISERLGKTLTQRRQYLRYREEHHLRFQEGLDDNENGYDGSKGIGTTIASYVPQDSISDIPVPLEDTEDNYSEISTISYASTASDQGVPRIPPIPLGYESGPFLCPFCRMIILIDPESEWKAKLEWKKHVYRDLRPYLCLKVQCTMANHDFEKRKNWIRHMLQEHWRVWTCPFDCGLGFHDPKDSRNHTLENHKAQVITERVDNLVSLSSHVDLTRAEGKCPLCLTFDIKNSRMYESHVGKHLEQLSLFVLPQNIDGETEQDNVTEEDRRGDRETSSDEAESSNIRSQAGKEEPPELRYSHEFHSAKREPRRVIYFCSALASYDKAFYESTTPTGVADTCGYCGLDFTRSGINPEGHVRHATEQDWDDRVRHLQDNHKFRGCHSSKGFVRADYFQRHLKESHAGIIGTWSTILLSACMTEEAAHSSRSVKRMGASRVPALEEYEALARRRSGGVRKTE